MYSAANHYVLKIAKGHGIKTVYASILAVNHIMLHMFKTRGFKLTKIKMATMLKSKLIKSSSKKMCKL